MSRGSDHFEEHPSKFIQGVYRAYCHKAYSDEYTGRLFVRLEVDLGFETYRFFSLPLLNLDSPRVVADEPSEQHAALAMVTRANQLVLNKPVLAIFYPDESRYKSYTVSIFFYLPDIQKNWHSLEDQLVREGHSCWKDQSLQPPTLE